MYQRSYYNIAEVLSVAGGLYSSIFGIGYLFTIAFSYNLMMSSLIRQMYAFKPKFPQEKTSDDKKKKKGKKETKKDNDYPDNDHIYDDELTLKQRQLEAEKLEKQKTGKG